MNFKDDQTNRWVEFQQKKSTIGIHVEGVMNHGTQNISASMENLFMVEARAEELEEVVNMEA